MMVSLIVAADDNYGIGFANKIPWHLPNDLKHFKYLTWGLPVVMGRKTFESLGKPLPGRKNIVLSKTLNCSMPDVFVVKDAESAMHLIQGFGVNEMMVIGGGEVYKLFSEKADKVYFTHVLGSFEADTFFPLSVMQHAKYQLVSKQSFLQDEKHSHAYEFHVYEKVVKN